jgi:phage gp16-like protein
MIATTVRLPPEAKAFIQGEAEMNASSQNSEIVRAIRAAMKAKGPAGTAIPPSHDHDHSPQKEPANEQPAE